LTGPSKSEDLQGRTTKLQWAFLRGTQFGPSTPATEVSGRICISPKRVGCSLEGAADRHHLIYDASDGARDEVETAGAAVGRIEGDPARWLLAVAGSAGREQL